MATTLYTYLGGNPIAYNFDYFTSQETDGRQRKLFKNLSKSYSDRSGNWLKDREKKEE